ncbi:twin-arginine translocase TatA/TatE family subunit [Tabrizicola sp. J26]|uniref:twin-arginine translocase TatA/TatE family subunit n=1 Tax=Alitabrizicola rongguiensis TaxID=2909234 RepID=UPI001F25A2E3|nr:twin-arginine translocase TatA/TatE family subunit [Tabrizicola rongguiensis]MCF1709052.1 twin-arginine translocase TatA/TatE family subunit [Tabrizicola rongguiensis]
MGEFSLSHILVVAVVVILLFGRGKVGALMGEVGKGISAFKNGVREGAEDPASSVAQTVADAEPQKALPHPAVETSKA